MSEHTQEERRVECEVATETDIVEFVHGLGGPVVITAYDGEGRQVGYVADVEISENEVEVIVIPGTVARLVAAPAPPEEDDGQE